MKPTIKVLVATPCAGGVVHVQWLLSFLATWDAIQKYNSTPGNRQIQMGIYTLANESLISRGRNHCAAISLYQKHDKLLFIDADQSWTPDVFIKLVTSDRPIIGAVTPLKILPIHLNYIPLKADEKYHSDRARSPAGLKTMHKAHGVDEIQIAYIGTGMLAIDVAKCLMPMTEIAAPYRYPSPETGENRTEWNLFDTSPINKECLSEDWGFLHKARSIGIEPWINASCIIGHTGNYTFRVDEAEFPSQQFVYDSRNQ